MKKLVLIALAVLLVAVPAIYAQDTAIYEDDLISFEYPAGWQAVLSENNNYLVSNAADPQTVGELQAPFAQGEARFTIYSISTESNLRLNENVSTDYAEGFLASIYLFQQVIVASFNDIDPDAIGIDQTEQGSIFEDADREIIIRALEINDGDIIIVIIETFSGELDDHLEAFEAFVESIELK